MQRVLASCVADRLEADFETLHQLSEPTWVILLSIRDYYQLTRQAGLPFHFNDLLFFVCGRLYYHSIQNAGPFDKEHFEAIVAEVRARGIKRGESVAFRLDDISRPKSLRNPKPGEGLARGDGVGNVRASVDAHGKLKVVIETNDLGHAGEYGFAYSEELISPRRRGYDPPHEQSLPGHLKFLLKKINDHWWEVGYSELQ